MIWQLDLILLTLVIIDPHIARDPRLVLQATVLQMAIALFDAGTMWVLIRALGAWADPGAVFASFMIASLLRTFGFVPGGLGTFEAASITTLKVAGIPLPVALSVTLMFRGLSFWLPMLPGLVLARRLSAPAQGGSQGHRDTAYWAMEPGDVATRLDTGKAGLSTDEAARRLERFGRNEIGERATLTRLGVLWNQFCSWYWLLGWLFGAQSWWSDMNFLNWSAYTFTTFMAVIWRSLINALGGALAGLLVALVYNVVADMMGGLKLNIE